MTQKTRHAPPKAGAMMEALRGLGYSTAAALADIIDNSISAGASEVRVRFDWDGHDSRISVLDDGRGMNDPELEAAMTLGTINPLDERAPTDLGRFGLGLKTASFSQCRSLTVASKREGQKIVCLRWDLDAIASDPEGIPNSADADWKIDVRKSTARPPVFVRSWLTGLAENTREKARKVFAYRGAPTPGPSGAPIDQAWRVEHLRSGVRYRIDEGHPAVAAVIEASGDRRDLVRAMLRVVEETVPVQRIWLDTAENKDTPRTGFSGEPEMAPDGVRTVLLTLFRDMVGRRGMSPAAAVRALSSTEPFQNFPKLVAALPEAAMESDKGNAG